MLELVAFGGTDVGKKRKNNEDSYAVDADRGVYIVADGMGGHASGEDASRFAVSMTREHLNANAYAIEQYRATPNDQTKAALLQVIEKAIQGACARVYAIGQAEPQKRGMGTTIDVVVRVGSQVVLGHVGDSRVYVVRNGQSYRLTEDHTLVAQQVKAGVMSPEDAEQSTMKGILTRAVGTHASVQVDTLLLDLMAGDVLLLCTDGLHKYLHDQEIPARLREASPAQVQALIDHALASGGSDNVTAIVLGVQAPQAAAQAAEAKAETAKAGSRIDAVRALPLFQHLSYKEQVAVLSVASNRSYQTGQDIVREADPGLEMFVVVEGRVAVHRGNIKIAELAAGGHFGEMALVDDAPRSASVRALAPTDCLVLSREALSNLMKLDPVLAVKVLWSFVEVLSGRLRTVNAELTDFKLEHPERRSSVPPFVAG